MASPITLSAYYRFKKPTGSYKDRQGTVAVYPDQGEIEIPGLGRVDGSDVNQILWGELEYGGRAVEGLVQSYGVAVKGDRYDFGHITESRPTYVLGKWLKPELPPVEKSNAARLARTLAQVCRNARVEKVVLGHAAQIVTKWRLEGNTVVPLFGSTQHLLLTDRGFYFYNGNVFGPLSGAMTLHAATVLPFDAICAVQVHEHTFCNYHDEIQRWAKQVGGELAEIVTDRVASAFYVDKIFSGLQLVQHLESKLVGGARVVIVYPTEGKPKAFFVAEEIDVAGRIAPYLNPEKKGGREKGGRKSFSRKTDLRKGRRGAR